MSDFPRTFGPYEILSELGRGTTGTVYKGYDNVLKRFVALKMPQLGTGAKRATRANRFFRECQIVASLHFGPDANIPPLYDVGECHEQPYSIRKLIDGSTLEERASAGLLDLRTGLQVLLTIARTVDRIHQHGFVHRNLHPSNILITTDNRPKLIGFGRAGLLEHEGLPPGATGTPAAVDAGALQALVIWLCEALRQPLPPSLEVMREPGSMGSPATVAATIEIFLR